MRTVTHSYPLLGLALYLALSACHKSVTDAQPGNPLHDSAQSILIMPDTTKSTAPFPHTASSGCSYAPDYGDSIIYPQSPGGNNDYTISPINKPGSGKYFSWPVGLVIDSLTGTIDVTKSETGQKYAIGFVKSGSRDTCLNGLTLGGAGYMDSVYDLSTGASSAVPYFDANPSLPSPCSNGQGNGQGNSGGCKFDISDFASQQHVIVDKHTGIIDLNKTLNGKGNTVGAFGLLPFSGEFIYTTLYYQVGDKSNNALQHITLQLVYYNHLSDVPTGLLANIGISINNLLTGQLLSTTTNPRPPLIVIVRSK